MMKKFLIGVISITILIAIILLYNNVNSKNSIHTVSLNDAKDLKDYYGSFLKVPEPQFLEYTNKLSVENTTKNLFLLHQNGINFDEDIAFDETSKIFTEEWNHLNITNSSNVDKLVIEDQKVHICYYYLMLAKELNKQLPKDNAKNIIEFYNEYITNYISKTFVNKSIEMCIKDRLSFICGYFNSNKEYENMTNKTNQQLLKIVMNDFSSLNKLQTNIDDLMNIMYAVSALDELGYKGDIWSKDLDNSLCSFIESKDFEEINYYEKAILLNKFLSIYKGTTYFDLKKVGNDVLSDFSNELPISNTLTFECLNLFNKCGIGNEQVRIFLEKIPHNSNYGFYEARVLIPTYRNLYFSVQVEKMLGIDKDLVDNYIDVTLKKIKQDSISFEEMYYLWLICKENKEIEKKFKSANDGDISKSQDYVANTEINEQNFIQYYYATKILLESGNTNFVQKYLEKIETYISILKQKYGNIQEFSYIDVLYKDILSYYPNQYPNSESIWKETLKLKPSNFYLDTIKVYVEIANRLDVRPSLNDLIEVNNQLKRYLTIIGYCPVNNEKYTTLQATYNGLYVEYCLQNIN